MINENNLVEKSRNVIAMQCLDMGEQELKILDVYLAKINPRDKSTRNVQFTKREYEMLLGVDRLRTERLEEYIEHLMKNIVTIPIPMENGKVKKSKHILFPDAVLEPTESGNYNIYLSINQFFDEVFFNIDNLGYIRYRLKYVIKLKSKYDIKLYLCLKQFEYNEPKLVEISVDKLKQYIECTKISYNTYSAFNRAVLKPAIQRINDYTDIEVEYKKNRKTTWRDDVIEFIVRKKKIKHDINAELEAKVQEIQEVNVIPYSIPEDVYNDSDFDLEFLKLKIASVYPDDETKVLEILGKANIRYDSKNVKSPFLYYLGIVKKILEEPLTPVKEKIAEQKPNKFHNFVQREYDIDALVSKLSN